ncbi:hypothetical protein BraRD5C2_76500 [Bradyrhizobium sp. RD5-C2]|nr:hypothetical protein BraRD5C2_76500 [Bradyrhizobium sp. RD5-C2]
MYFSGSGRRLNAEQLVEPRALIAVTEPGFNRPIDHKRKRDGQKEREKIFGKEATKSISDNHAPIPENATEISISPKMKA